MTTRIHAVHSLEQVREAHAVLDANVQIGKVVLALSPNAASERPQEGR